MKKMIVRSSLTRVLCAGLLISGCVGAVPTPKDTLTVVAGTDNNTFTPTNDGLGNWAYSELYSGSTFTDGIPATVTLTNGSTNINSYTITLSAVPPALAA